MTEHLFSNFSSYEFEILCRDLLNEEYRLNIKVGHGLSELILQFSSFKAGKDGGIDLYYHNEGVKVIGQVKHSSGNFTDLLRMLKKSDGSLSEAEKVRRQNPDKYIFMTSVPLSLANKHLLIEHFAPYIKSDMDIYGKEDLNRLLAQFKHVERRHVKLYFTNPAVIEHLSAAATVSRSRFKVSEILDEVKNFVQTESFSKALSILEEKKLLILKGQPGVGKTTLAKLLCMYYLEQNYEFVEISDLDNELENLLEIPGKQVFYYDDFLGSNQYMIKNALKNEARLSSLLRRIARNPNKAIIMTTRTNVMKDAEYKSEKLSRIFSALSKFEVEAGNLSYREKMEIVRRHIEKNGVGENLFPEDLIDHAVNHRNFSPRLIEFITDARNVEKNAFDYRSFVGKSFENPKELWAFAYEHQISGTQRIYLNHLFLFADSAAGSVFKGSFENRMRFEAKNNNHNLTHNEFKESTAIMDGTFVNIDNGDHDDYNDYFIEFINPSVADFLIREIKTATAMIADSVRAFDRPEILLERFNHAAKDLLNLIDETELRQILLCPKAFSFFSGSDAKLTLLSVLRSYFTIEDIERAVPGEMQAMLTLALPKSSPDEYLKFLRDYQESNLVRAFIRENYIPVFTQFAKKVRYENQFDDILQAFKIFDLDYDRFLENEEANTAMYEAFTTILEDAVDEFVFIRQDKIFTDDDVEELYADASTTFHRFFEKIDDAKEILERILDSKSWKGIMEYNEFKSFGI